MKLGFYFLSLLLRLPGKLSVKMVVELKNHHALRLSWGTLVSMQDFCTMKNFSCQCTLITIHLEPSLVNILN